MFRSLHFPTSFHIFPFLSSVLVLPRGVQRDSLERSPPKAGVELLGTHRGSHKHKNTVIQPVELNLLVKKQRPSIFLSSDLMGMIWAPEPRLPTSPSEVSSRLLQLLCWKKSRPGFVAKILAMEEGLFLLFCSSLWA